MSEGKQREQVDAPLRRVGFEILLHRIGIQEEQDARAAAIHEEVGPGVVRALVHRPARGAVISLSGLDGSGKSSQAQALRDALLNQGIDAAVKWTRISHNPSLDVIAAPVKRLLRKETPAGGGSGERATAKALRERNALVRQAWVTVVAAGIAGIQRRATAAHLRHGRTVICDRGSLRHQRAWRVCRWR